jgi:hypothetical protein
MPALQWIRQTAYYCLVAASVDLKVQCGPLQYFAITAGDRKEPQGSEAAALSSASNPGTGVTGAGREHRTYILQYKIGPKQRRMTLGNVAKIGLDDAQRKARKLFGQIADGKDPANEKAVARTTAFPHL